MTPTSKVIQLTAVTWSDQILALCEDGSIWEYAPFLGIDEPWSLMFEAPVVPPDGGPAMSVSPNGLIPRLP